jgi:hypothetical protein
LINSIATHHQTHNQCLILIMCLICKSINNSKVILSTLIDYWLRSSFNWTNQFIYNIPSDRQLNCDSNHIYTYITIISFELMNHKVDRKAMKSNINPKDLMVVLLYIYIYIIKLISQLNRVYFVCCFVWSWSESMTIQQYIWSLKSTLIYIYIFDWCISSGCCWKESLTDRQLLLIGVWT